MNSPAENPGTLVVERVFPHPPEKLWRALTESPLLTQWMMNNDFEPVVGRRFQFRADPMPNWNGVVDCEVLVVEPFQRLSYNWGVGGRESGLQWVVLWTLTPTEGGTHVRMEQSGFGPDQQAAYGGAKYGWQKFFGGLERVLGEMVSPMKSEPSFPQESASAFIDEKIKGLKDWRGKTFAQLRRVIHEADPEIVEEVKWVKPTNPGTPVFSHGGIVCTGETYKSVVKLTFARGAALKDPAGLFNSSLDGNVRRAIDFHEGEEVDEAALRDLLRAAVALNVGSAKKPKARRTSR